MINQKRGAKRGGFGDSVHFLKSLISTPHLTGAIAPSGPALARAMAAAAGPPAQGLVVELGPGTGPVTRALLDVGLDRRRLVMVEYNPQFCRMLRERHPEARVIQGDAYNLPRTLAEISGEPVSAFVSSLPLLNRTPRDRVKLIDDAFERMGADGLFVQFTYGPSSPIPREHIANRYSSDRGPPIWVNIPPARVWMYRLGHPAPERSEALSRQQASE